MIEPPPMVKWPDRFTLWAFEEECDFNYALDKIRLDPDVKDYFSDTYEPHGQTCMQNTKSKIYVIGFRQLDHFHVQGEISPTNPFQINELDKSPDAVMRETGHCYLDGVLSRFQGKEVIIDIKEVKQYPYYPPPKAP